jgi:hypothetical protein
MISGFEFMYTYTSLNFEDDHFLKKEYIGFLRPLVPLSVLFSSFARGIVEGTALLFCPTVHDLL